MSNTDKIVIIHIITGVITIGKFVIESARYEYCWEHQDTPGMNKSIVKVGTSVLALLLIVISMSIIIYNT